MTIRLLTPSEEHIYKDFLDTQVPNLFIRSPLYGTFYDLMDEKYFVIGIFEGEKMIGGCMLVSTHAKRGNYLYAPYGPVIDFQNKELVHSFIEFIKELGKKEHMDFIKISPFAEDKPETIEMLKSFGCTSSPMHVLPETIWYLPLCTTEEDLLMNMRKTTRNLVRRADKDGIEIKVSTDSKALDDFFPLFNETAKRHKFVGFTEKYIRNEFLTMAKGGHARVYTAVHEGDILSSAIIYFYGDTAVYRHGASTHELKANMPGSYAIQWQAIRDARALSLSYYNFWGICPDENNTAHPFWGITKFKTGFGGERKDVLHCLDLPLTNKYRIYWIIETIRRWKRGF